MYPQNDWETSKYWTCESISNAVSSDGVNPPRRVQDVIRLSVALLVLAFTTVAIPPTAAAQSPSAHPVAAAHDVTDVTSAPIGSDESYRNPASWFDRRYVQYLIRTGQNDTDTLRSTFAEMLEDEHLLATYARKQGLAQDSVGQTIMRRAQLEVIGARFYDDTLRARIAPPTDQELRWAFVHENTTVRARQLFFRNETDAQSWYLALSTGAIDFEQAVMERYQLSAIDSTAGDLGWMTFASVDATVSDILWVTPVDSITAPVKSKAGYHIFKVDDRAREVLLTETAYAQRKPSLYLEWWQRKTQLEGNTFINGLLENRSPRSDSVNLAILDLGINALIRNTQRRDERSSPANQGIFREQQAARIDWRDARNILPQNAPLVYYTGPNGESTVFTFGDWLFWLPSLNEIEARNTPVASVGRALRNQVLAEEGISRGLDDQTTDSLATRSAEPLLALRVRTALRQEHDDIEQALLAEYELLKGLRDQSNQAN